MMRGRTVRDAGAARALAKRKRLEPLALDHRFGDVEDLAAQILGEFRRGSPDGTSGLSAAH
jgi:hypothetical protein